MISRALSFLAGLLCGVLFNACEARAWTLTDVHAPNRPTNAADIDCNGEKRIPLTLTAHCTSSCTIGQTGERGPGVLVLELSTGPDTWMRAQRTIIYVGRGEYGEIDLEPAFVATWQQQYEQECVRVRWYWAAHRDLGVIGLRSEPMGWCFRAGER